MSWGDKGLEYTLKSCCTFFHCFLPCCIACSMSSLPCAYKKLQNRSSLSFCGKSSMKSSMLSTAFKRRWGICSFNLCLDSFLRDFDLLLLRLRLRLCLLQWLWQGDPSFCQHLVHPSPFNTWLTNRWLFSLAGWKSKSKYPQGRSEFLKGF